MIDWTSWMDYGFMKMALAAILIITPLFGLMGTMIVNKKMAYFSDALGHSALTGIAVGVVCGIPDTNISMVIFAVVFALLLKSEAEVPYQPIRLFRFFPPVRLRLVWQSCQKAEISVNIRVF